jgi:hypothetical protein
LPDAGPAIQSRHPAEVLTGYRHDLVAPQPVCGPMDHAFLCLRDFLHAVAKSPMEELAVHNDRQN